MLGYRRKSLDRAHNLLTMLKDNPEDIESLRDLQQLLLHEIMRTETSGRKVKADLRAVQGGAAHSKAKRAWSLKSRLEKIRQVAFIWRTFGDAIAFLYLDKFALKQTFYSVESTAPQQTSGFLSDKTGLYSEIAALEAILESGVPAMLTDITNTIRHGDICILVGPDPFLVEVKSSSGLDRRGRRQRDELKRLQAFFETDEVDMLRGLGPARRVSASVEQVDYSEEINSCIERALSCGYDVTQPEPGVYYVVFACKHNQVQVNEVLDSLVLKQPWFFSLNELKNLRAWMPYVPFTASLKSREHLWAFIRGDVYILVVLDFQKLLDVAECCGATARIDLNNAEYPLWIKVSHLEAEIAVSTHILRRVGLEFMSPASLVKAAIESVEKVAVEVEHALPNDQGVALAG
ncbi:hypothetical protein [Rhodopseudomonas palustris]|uniref:hypothetical protein n=1 Tax=Rhodopseudomonas palustris TaxID=1076 RepID=UPI000D1B9128|nr:hypothetical protein [Rhodopseudomonas palustris]AVT81416.1 hypothetical protein RPYSC3_25550 [Rhodopseudomonas palustris]